LPNTSFYLLAFSNKVRKSPWQRFVWIWWHGQNVSRCVKAL